MFCARGGEILVLGKGGAGSEEVSPELSQCLS